MKHYFCIGRISLGVLLLGVALVQSFSSPRIISPPKSETTTSITTFLPDSEHSTFADHVVVSPDPVMDVLTDAPEEEFEEDATEWEDEEAFVHFPSTDLTAKEAIELCLDGLMNNDSPYKNAGLETCWNFSNDMCRGQHGGRFDYFINFSVNPVFSHMINPRSWAIFEEGPEIAGTKTRGAMKTFLVGVQPSGGDDDTEPKQFLITLQKERRPPRKGCWMIYECIFKKNAFLKTI